MNQEFDISFAKQLDKQDPLSLYRNDFHIPQHNGQDAIYFTGHSLGLQPKNHNKYLKKELKDWGSLGVEGHFDARSPWFQYHKFLEKHTASLVGAKQTEVVTMNALSVNLHFLLSSFYNPTSKKYKILCEPTLFPSDLFVLQSQIQSRGFDPKESIIFIPANSDGVIEEQDIYSAIKENKEHLALIFIGGVNYYTGQIFDIQKITHIGHQNDIIVGFDLAHAVGNIQLALHDWQVDFAAWCSYKYLNSGPGNVSSVFIHEKQIAKEPFRLSAWWGHEEKSRFEIQDVFQPIKTAEGWQLSNAPVFGMAIYRVSLEIFHKVGMLKLIERRIKLSSYLEDCIDVFNKQSKELKISIITPGSPEKRGSQLSLRINKHAKKLYNYLKSSGVFVDWREPNVIRISTAPLYNSFEDISKFHHILLNEFTK